MRFQAQLAKRGLNLREARSTLARSEKVSARSASPPLESTLALCYILEGSEEKFC